LTGLSAEQTKDMARELLATDKAQNLSVESVTGVTGATSVSFTSSKITDGYYLIEDSTAATDDRALSSVMLVSPVDGVYDKSEIYEDAAPEGGEKNGEYDNGEAFTDGVTITLKADKPSIVKKIVETQGNGVYDADAGETFTDAGEMNGVYDEGEAFEDSNLVDTNTAIVGETVNYQLMSVVPDTTYYDYYIFKMTDTFETGLDVVYNATADVTTNPDAKGVIINLVSQDESKTVKLVDGKDYAVKLVDSASDGHYENMYIEFLDMKTLGSQYAGYDIIVNYGAIVNEDTKIGDTGNVNDIYLTYSNDPNHSSDLDIDNDGIPNDEDDDVDGDGENNDVDTDDDGDGTEDTNDDTPSGDTPDNPTTDTPNDKVITYLTKIRIYKVDEDDNKLTGATFKITNSANTITHIVKVGDNGAAIVSTSDSTKIDGAVDNVDVEVDANGYLVFSGLGEGTYTIEEVTPPNGYNKADNKTVEITCVLKNVVADGTETCEWKYDGNTVTGDDPYTIKVINRKGALFPTTGGMGTTIFTVLGASLMVGAAGAFAIKRKTMDK
ncbi:MAG: LPXTG cell wall anchor domain-containing protein, partial [Oscillospiraceae bacterium]|nr:LPXTG cell wall anchor domain-containing protein [Oscillospiraceae bacterium]